MTPKIEHYIKIQYFTILNIEIRILPLPNGKFISQYKKKSFFRDKWVNLVTYRGLNEAFPSNSIVDCKKSILYHFSEELKYPIGTLLFLNNK